MRKLDLMTMQPISGTFGNSKCSPEMLLATAKGVHMEKKPKAFTYRHPV